MQALSIISAYPGEMNRRNENWGLGRTIRLLRTGQDLNRKELAERTGLSYPYLSEIESGKKTPSAKALAVIANALGVPAHVLMEMADSLANQTDRSMASTYFHTGATDPAPPPAALISASVPPPAAPPPAGAEAPAPADDVAEIAEVARTLGAEDRNRLLDFARRLRR
jgi:transcriptional regulator with XRE-family HTH domain